MNLGHLRRAPFHLDEAAVAWVEATINSLTLAQKVGQLFVHASFGQDQGELARLIDLQPAGITRFFTPDMAFETNLLDSLRAQSVIPLLISADLEGSRMSLPFGTEVPNPLALAAIDDVQATTEVARIMAQEAVALGINWTFTPVLDINAAFRSPIVATRGFGSDIDCIKRHALAQMAVFQAHGIAATVKHWPGEGYDDRDQHLLTTQIPLSVEQWHNSFGRLYCAAIDQGVMSVMSAHIAFPAYARQCDPNSGIEAFQPASVSSILNKTLLRGELGFNGVIVSDATQMAGFGAWAARPEMLAQVIQNGCDIILFSTDPHADQAIIQSAIANGTITQERLYDALSRSLGLKAWLGLHQQKPQISRDPQTSFANARNVASAAAITARAPTLVKDTRGLLPLCPQRHQRVLVVSGGIVSPLHPDGQPFALIEQLRGEGFDVTVYDQTLQITPKDWDLMLFLLGEETLLTRGRIFVDWARIMGNLGASMARHWHEIPTAMISFGYPYALYDAPRVPCYINAYTTMDSMQTAVLDALLGRISWNRHNPVDPFCGLEDAAY
jgi:beta-N-acetylhexosaminidase